MGLGLGRAWGERARGGEQVQGRCLDAVLLHVRQQVGVRSKAELILILVAQAIVPGQGWG